MPIIVMALILVVVTVVIIVGTVLFFITKKRTIQNYQRGLNMKVLQIHLPPISEDVETKSRDGREAVEENISKASVLYNLLTSIAEESNFKTSFYGQRHIGFEIITQAGLVQFYVVAPQNLVALVRQAITSAYRGAKVELTKDHNLYSKQASSKTTLGGELILKEKFAYPLATYLDSRQDIMKALLSSLHDLDENSGAGIQILLRPAYKKWTKEAQAQADKKILKKSNIFKEFLLGFVKPADSQAGDDKKELSNLDKKIIESIEKKITQPGFETLIRLLVTTPQMSQTQNTYDNLLAAFTLLDAPKSNGFKHRKAKNLKQFVLDFDLRLFPPNFRSNILNVDELSSIFHLPDQANIPTSQIYRLTSKQIDGPRHFLSQGLLLGHNVFRGQNKAVTLSDEDRMRHMYVVGQTGSGKSVFLENLVRQDLKAGKGLAFVDPHGETAEKILTFIPPERMDDVIYFHPGSMEYPMGLNIFEHEEEDKQDFLIQEAITMLYKLYDPNRTGIIGPRYEHMFRNAAKLIMADPNGGTFIDIPKLFNDRRYVLQKLRHIKDQSIIDFWSKEIIDAERSSDFGDMKSWFISKFSAFLSNTMMRNIIGQNKSSFDLRRVMDEGKVVIINLSQGRLGELNMKFLGMIFVAKFQIAAMSRADTIESQRQDFTLYIDEFQNFVIDSFANILSAARKYRLALVAANQHITQLSEEIRDAVYGNVGTAVSFRINAADAENLIKQFYSPTFEINDLTRLPVGHTIVRTLVEGAPTMPFNMVTPPPSEVHDHQARLKIEKQLLKRYGRPRAEVEAEIKARLDLEERPFVASSPSPTNLPPSFRPSTPSFRPPSPVLNDKDDFLAGWFEYKKMLELKKTKLKKTSHKTSKTLKNKKSN